MPTRTRVEDMWLPTRSGRTVDMLSPRPEDIDFNDVATGLANANRFAGQLEEPYSVAQHSAIGADVVYEEAIARGLGRGRSRDLAAAFTLHDAHEFVIGDKTPIFVAALGAVGGFDATGAMSELKARMDRAIYARAERSALLSDAAARAVVHEMDMAMCRRERDDLVAGVAKPWRPDIDEARLLRIPKIAPVCWREARAMWLQRFDRYVAAG